MYFLRCISGDMGSTHSGNSHHGNSHQNVSQIVLYANEMHKIKGAITQKVEMNIKKAQEKDTFYYDKKHCNLKVCTAYYTVTYLLSIKSVGIWSRGSSTSYKQPSRL